ncbi:MAG TPA: hypothetical protein PKE31_10345 [Pseudomonadota bacterium]|nr:hypothetical protein [Pseudomonadota bacterium]
MSDRIDPRRQTKEIREALARFEPEQVLDILTHVFRQYVVEGSSAPPIQMQDELAGLNFVQIIERLQLRLDVPELRLFEVQAGRVMVRLDGRLHPLEIGDTRPEPLPVSRVVNMQPMSSAAQTSQPAPATSAPGTESRETTAAAARSQPVPPSVRPAAQAAQAAQATQATQRPVPAARPAATPSPTAPANPSSAPAASSAPVRPDKAQVEKPESPGGRFGLLEID